LLLLDPFRNRSPKLNLSFIRLRALVTLPPGILTAFPPPHPTSKTWIDPKTRVLWMAPSFRSSLLHSFS
jgi:hypothetical protein